MVAQQIRGSSKNNTQYIAQARAHTHTNVPKHTQSHEHVRMHMCKSKHVHKNNTELNNAMWLLMLTLASTSITTAILEAY